MAKEKRVGCLLMAAGAGTRFGPDKLLTEFHGRPLIRRAMDAVPKSRLCQVAVVTGDPRIAGLAADYGFAALRNDRPELGVSRTIRLGLALLSPGCDGVIFQVADQPLLRRETMERLLDLWLCHPSSIVVPTAEGRWGNPCIFPADLFPALQALTGDVGGKAVIRTCRDRVLEMPVDPRELADTDTAEEFTLLLRQDPPQASDITPNEKAEAF